MSQHTNLQPYRRHPSEEDDTDLLFEVEFEDSDSDHPIDAFFQHMDSHIARTDEQNNNNNSNNLFEFDEIFPVPDEYSLNNNYVSSPSVQRETQLHYSNNSTDHCNTDVHSNIEVHDSNDAHGNTEVNGNSSVHDTIPDSELIEAIFQDINVGPIFSPADFIDPFQTTETVAQTVQAVPSSEWDQIVPEPTEERPPTANVDANISGLVLPTNHGLVLPTNYGLVLPTNNGLVLPTNNGLVLPTNTATRQRIPNPNSGNDSNNNPDETGPMDEKFVKLSDILQDSMLLGPIRKFNEQNVGCSRDLQNDQHTVDESSNQSIEEEQLEHQTTERVRYTHNMVNKRGEKVNAKQPKPYQCPICHRYGQTPTHIRRHMKSMHSGIRDYTCEFCQNDGKPYKGSARKDHFCKHLDKVHHMAKEEIKEYVKLNFGHVKDH